LTPNISNQLRNFIILQTNSQYVLILHSFNTSFKNTLDATTTYYVKIAKTNLICMKFHKYINNFQHTGYVDKIQCR